MENASKALLIAGAILIAILLIALGMMAYTAGKSQVDKSSTSLNTQQVQSLNGQFAGFEGRKNGSEVRALVNLVKTVNADKNSAFSSLHNGAGVYLNNTTVSSFEASTIGKNISINKYYDVQLYYADGGLINNLSINPAAN